MDAVSFLQTSTEALTDAQLPKPSLILAILADFQTELIVGILAIVTHFLFFYKPAAAASKTAPQKSTATDKNNRASPNKPNTARHTDIARTQHITNLKKALRAGHVKEVMSHFEALETMFQTQDCKCLIVAKLMKQIVSLMAQNAAMSDFLSLVVKLDLLEITIDYVIGYCFSEDAIDTALLKKIEELGHEQGVKMSASAYLHFLKGAGSTRDHLHSQRIMSQARQAGVADITTYTHYLHTMLRCGSACPTDPKRAWATAEVCKVLENMRMEGLQLPLISFNKLLQTAISSPAANVWAILGEMKLLKVKPDKVTFSTVLKSRFVNKQAGNIGRVLLEAMDDFDDEIDEVLVNSLVDACVRCGSPELLMPFLTKRRNIGKTQTGAHTYSSIIRAYGQVHDIRGAWKTWEEMCSNGVAPISVTVGCMMEALCTNGDVNGACELIQDLQKEEETANLVNAATYGSILKAFSHQKNFTRMWEVYDEMTSLKLKFSAVTFNILVDSCSRSGDLKRIPQLLDLMEAHGIEMGVMTYGAVLKAYCHNNMLEQAFALFEEMSETSGLAPDEVVYNTMLDGCACNCKYELGMSLYQHMKQSGVTPSSYTLAVLVKLANRCKKLDEGFALCDELTKAYGFRMNVHIFDNLIQACTYHNSLQRAIDTLERMLSEGVKPSARTFNVLLNACLSCGAASDFDGLLRAAMGLRCVPQRWAQFPKSLFRCEGGMLNNPGLRTASGRPDDFVSDVMKARIELEDVKLAAALLDDLGKVPGLKLDPKLRRQLLAKISRSTAE